MHCYHFKSILIQPDSLFNSIIKDNLHSICDDLCILESIVSQGEFLIVAGAAPAEERN
jgi:hypothetical protein